MARIRFDKLLIKRRFVENQQQAIDLITSGIILVNGAIQTSPNSFIDSGCSIEFIKSKKRFVSRGGFKLEKALIDFDIDPKLKRCLDVGASTGGFTDCLLQFGAQQVVAVDVGHGHLDISLRNDPRVLVLEKTHAKNMNLDTIGGFCDLGVMDVSFTSILPLLDSVMGCLNPQELIVLIKPQFECDVSSLDRHGVVIDFDVHKSIIQMIRDTIRNKYILSDLIKSPITGRKGNIEYLALIIGKKHTARLDDVVPDSKIDEIVFSVN